MRMNGDFGHLEIENSSSSSNETASKNLSEKRLTALGPRKTLFRICLECCLDC